MRLDLDGVEHRVYFEEAGTGVPVLLQHTAGSDGRQWRHLFEAGDLTARFRLIAYDLPYHGKSLPPEGVAWWAEEYRLTTEAAMAVPLALSAALGLDRPVFMGCSIGGMLALDLALHHPDAFRAVIAVQGSLRAEARWDDTEGLHHPQVSNEYKANLMLGLMAPTAPEWYRRETAFAYSQGWPPSFRGDLWYWMVDHDLRETASGIDTGRVAVHLLTGEYDYATSPAHGRAAHEAIAGSTFTVMEGMGHFPMSEDPQRFLDHLRPVLDRIATAP